MSRYFEVMRATIERHGGTVEKFIGDAVMAVFGVPAAFMRTMRLGRAGRRRRCGSGCPLAEELGVAPRFRIGVNTGAVLTGDGERLATGDAVNVAARLEQAARAG